MERERGRAEGGREIGREEERGGRERERERGRRERETVGGREGDRELCLDTLANIVVATFMPIKPIQ